MNFFKYEHGLLSRDDRSWLLLAVSLLGLLTFLAPSAQATEKRIEITPFAGSGGDIRFFSEERVSGDHWKKIQGRSGSDYLLQNEWLRTGLGGLESSAKLVLEEHSAEFRQAENSISQFINLKEECWLILGFGDVFAVKKGIETAISNRCLVQTETALIEIHTGSGLSDAEMKRRYDAELERRVSLASAVEDGTGADDESSLEDAGTPILLSAPISPTFPRRGDVPFFISHHGVDEAMETKVGNFSESGFGIIKIAFSGQEIFIFSGEVATIQSDQITIESFDIIKFRRQNPLAFGLVGDQADPIKVTTLDDLEDIPICETETTPPVFDESTDDVIMPAVTTCPIYQ